MQRWVPKILCCSFLLLRVILPAIGYQQAQPYFPGKWDDWERRTPEQAGINANLLNEAITFARTNYSPQRRDKNGVPVFQLYDEPYGDIVGPTKERGESNGLILRHGYIIAEWGDTRRVDMTFSVTKTYLSTTAGLAFDRGLIRDVRDRVGDYVQDAGFESEHNTGITWHQLLNQTSGWEGTLWGKPDWADRFNGTRRTSEEPGKHWRYNDVRVNQLALALLHVWRKPLPQVLKELVMDPIDASPTWRWHGYDNSWVTVDGAKMQSVSGGGHWGGGMFISTRDHARFGYLFQRGGKWKERQIISKKWIELASTPTPVQPTYGYMNWYLNTARKQFPSAPESSIFFLGNGTNMIWIDRDHDMVVVVRWQSQVDGVIKRVLAALDLRAQTR
jgi:CubicO group peptidase (beta-lactamase class C family)